jgi:hypothetical protein
MPGCTSFADPSFACIDMAQSLTRRIVTISMGLSGTQIADENRPMNVLSSPDRAVY